MLTAAWECAKKQWKLCVGFLLGIFSIFLIFRKGEDAEVLAAKTNAEKKIADAERIASEKREESLKKNLDSFFEKNEKIDERLRGKLKKIDEKKKKEVNDILESDDSNEIIARRLREFLGD